MSYQREHTQFLKCYTPCFSELVESNNFNRCLCGKVPNILARRMIQDDVYHKRDMANKLKHLVSARTSNYLMFMHYFKRGFFNITMINIC